MGDYYFRGTATSASEFVTEGRQKNMFRTNSNIGAILGYGGYGNSIFNSYSQLSGIRANAYSKLAKAYSKTSGNKQLQNMSAYNRLRTPVNNAQTAIRTVGNEAAELTSSAKVLTDTGKNSLSAAGINVGVDGKLSIDEEAFKKTDMNTVKSLFNGNGSYAQIVSSSAARVQLSATTQQLYGGSVYGRSGSYYNAFGGIDGYGGYGGLYSGYGFNSLF